MFVISTFSSPKIVPCKQKNRWLNTIALTKKMDFIFSHVYREGNTCADKLANLGLSISGLV